MSLGIDGHPGHFSEIQIGGELQEIRNGLITYFRHLGLRVNIPQSGSCCECQQHETQRKRESLHALLLIGFSLPMALTRKQDALYAIREVRARVYRSLDRDTAGSGAPAFVAVDSADFAGDNTNAGVGVHP